MNCIQWTYSWLPEPRRTDAPRSQSWPGAPCTRPASCASCGTSDDQIIHKYVIYVYVYMYIYIYMYTYRDIDMYNVDVVCMCILCIHIYIYIYIYIWPDHQTRYTSHGALIDSQPCISICVVSRSVAHAFGFKSCLTSVDQIIREIRISGRASCWLQRA